MIAELQRGLASLIHEGRVDSNDAYVQSVAQSERLDVVREVIASWRVLLLRQSVPLTVSLLGERGRFSVTTAEESPFIAEMACAFVEGFVDDADPLVAAAAKFERTMLRGAQGEAIDTAAAWSELGTAFAANNATWTPGTTTSSPTATER